MLHSAFTAVSRPCMSAYTRADALYDGLLIDVGQVAARAGFRYAVALTSDAWADCVTWTPADTARQIHQEQANRLWDLLAAARHAVRNAPNPHADRVEFVLERVPRGGRVMMFRPVGLVVTIGYGDAGEPVYTISLADE